MIDFEDEDDGWRACDKCYEGFTIWYSRVFGYDTENNGYVGDDLLCEKCFAEAKLGGR